MRRDGGPRIRVRAAAAAAILLAAIALLSGCARQNAARGPDVVAVETFLADMARQVAGDRLSVGSLIPAGVEPHGYEPAPRDVVAVAGARLLIVNGAGLESFLSRLIAGAGGAPRVVEASAGLVSRTAREGETAENPGAAGGVSVGGASAGAVAGAAAEPDPHFWLDPTLAVRYVENIRDGLVAVDPGGAGSYSANAAAYIAKLHALDRWIAAQLAAIPPADRKLVTNHESLGYFADRYGLRIVGTIIPSVSAEAAPSARQLARLVDALKAAGVKAVFLETGSSAQLPRQVAREAGAAVVTELYTHALSDPSGPAPSYIAMMEYDTRTIVSALTGGAEGTAR